MGKNYPGKREDYTVLIGAAGGIILKSIVHNSFATVAAGQEVHFDGNDRDYIVSNGALVALDGPLGGAAGPDPRVAELQAKIADLKAKLQAMIAGL